LIDGSFLQINNLSEGYNVMHLSNVMRWHDYASILFTVNV
jgi:hypothetical protein